MPSHVPPLSRFTPERHGPQWPAIPQVPPVPVETGTGTVNGAAVSGHVRPGQWPAVSQVPPVPVETDSGTLRG
ncbi:hypothetical protein GCM10009677_54900 [Sphaerisporangium rubeum]